MQISRPLLLACAAAACLTPILVRADNEAQIRAREALEQKMKDLDTQGPVTNAPPPPPAEAPKPKPAPKKTPPKPATPPPQKPNPPAVMVTPGQPVQQTPPPPAPKVEKPAPPPPPPVSKPATAKPVMQPPAPPPPVYSPAPVAPPANTESNEKMEEALHQKMIMQKSSAAGTNEAGPWTKPYTPPANQPQPPVPPPHPAPPQHPVTIMQTNQPAPTLPPMPAPPSSVSAAKQQKLDQLLQLYRSDQITPQEYHTQRAKILSEP